MTVAPISQAPERALIGALILEPERLPVVVDIVGPYDIYDTQAAKVYQAILSLYGAGASIDPVTIAAEMLRSGHADSVDSILDLLGCVTSGAHAPYHARQVARYAAVRSAKAELLQINRELDDASTAHDDEPLAALSTRIQLAGGLLGGRLRAGSEIESICAADVISEDVQMLWTPYMPLGKLVLLDGDPGCGKSYASLMVCGAFASGWGLPDPANSGHPGPQREPVNVAYASREDSIEDTLVPRLKWAGCDLQHVRFLTGVKRYGKGKAVPLTLQDVDALDREIAAHSYALLVIDPLQSYLGPGVKMAEAETTRPILDALGALARKHRCTIVLIRHLRKGTADRAIYRGMGGMDFAGVARSMLMIGRDPDDKNLRVLAHAKASIGAEGDSLAFRINRVDDIKAEFQWCGRSERDEDDIVAPEREKGDKQQEALAKDLVHRAMIGGPKSWNDVLINLKEEHNISRTVAYRAKVALGLVECGKDGRYSVLKLPEHSGNGWVERDAR